MFLEFLSEFKWTSGGISLISINHSVALSTNLEGSRAGSITGTIERGISPSLVWLWHLSAYCRETRVDTTQMSSAVSVRVCARTVDLNGYICVHKHVFVQCVFVSLYLLHLSWHANPSVKVWDVSSGVWLCGDLSCSNIQVWVPSLSVGLTPDRKDQAGCWQRQLCMTQELSKRLSLSGQPFHIHKSRPLRAKIYMLFVFGCYYSNSRYNCPQQTSLSLPYNTLQARTFCFQLRICKVQIEYIEISAKKEKNKHSEHTFILLKKLVDVTWLCLGERGSREEMGHLSLVPAN